jgi:hypothetical protein
MVNAGAPSFELVNERLQIGPVTVENRIVRAGYFAVLNGRNGTIDEDFIVNHERLAVGGLGLAIPEAGSVHDSCHEGLDVSHDAIIAGHRQLVERIDRDPIGRLRTPAPTGGRHGRACRLRRRPRISASFCRTRFRRSTRSATRSPVPLSRSRRPRRPHGLRAKVAA